LRINDLTGIVRAGFGGLRPACRWQRSTRRRWGQTWRTACRFLQDALAIADNPANGITEIRVAQGAYRPDRSEATPGGSGDRNATFHLLNNIALRGGYLGLGAAEGQDPDQRDINQYPDDPQRRPGGR
jgi:hypothetical protein